MKKLAFLSLLLLVTSQIVAQNPCGTTHTPTDKTNWIARATQLQNGLGSTEELKYVPIKFHLIGNSAGGGFYRQTNLYELMCSLNKQFDTTNIRFYMVLPTNFISNDAYYSFTDYSVGDQCMNQYNVANVCNVYINSSPAGNCGYAYYPQSGPFGGNAGIFLNISCSAPTGSTTLAHEMGHYLSLPHPFNNFGQLEYVNGSNCATAGDLFCDTRADFLDYRWSCPYTGANTDPNGDLYNPDQTLFMSYSLDNCQRRFSPQQANAMNVSVSADRPYLLNGGVNSFVNLAQPSLVSPSDSVVGLTSFNFTWRKVPNANGYIFRVGRASSPNSFHADVFTTDTFYSYSGNVNVFRFSSMWFRWSVKPVGNRSFCTNTSYHYFKPIINVSTQETAQNTNINIYPNTISPELPINIYCQEIETDAQLTLYDAQGKQILNQKLPALYQHQIYAPNPLSYGVYIAKIVGKKGIYTTKIVVN